MRISPLAFVRPATLILSVLTALAVAIGRGAPEATEVRHAEPVRYHAINWYLFRADDPTPRFLDVETGRLARVAFPEPDRLTYVSCSPWRDGRGQAQVVGLWDEASGSGAEHVSRSLGLARYTFPGGRVLDRVPLDVIPAGVPCWYPGTEPRLLFAATDGRLYHLAFDEPRKGGAPRE